MLNLFFATAPLIVYKAAKCAFDSVFDESSKQFVIYNNIIRALISIEEHAAQKQLLHAMFDKAELLRILDHTSVLSLKVYQEIIRYIGIDSNKFRRPLLIALYNKAAILLNLGRMKKYGSTLKAIKVLYTQENDKEGKEILTLLENYKPQQTVKIIDLSR